MDSFTSQVLANQLPIIQSSPSNSTFNYGEVWTLEWSVYDVSPSNWTVHVNSTTHYTYDWDKSETQLLWGADLTAGHYNITAEFVDRLGNSWLGHVQPLGGSGKII